MDTHGEAYLFNLSLLAITFAAVSVLVMLVRQTMGGKLSNFDIHLVTSYVSRGFAIAIAALVPSLIADFEFSSPTIWASASGLAALLLAWALANTLRQRSKIAKGLPPPFLIFAFGTQWTAIFVLIANAAVPVLQGGGLFKIALTVTLAVVMWAFVRRVSTLLGDKPSEDWDPKRA